MIDLKLRQPLRQQERLDKSLAELSSLSRRRIRQAIDDGGVYVNQKRCRKAGRLLQGGEKLRIVMLDNETLVPFDGDSQLIWQSNGLYLIHKYSGQYAQEALHRSSGTIPQELAAYLQLPPLQAKQLRPVHRLDKGTSGLMLLSDHPPLLQHLQQHWHSHVEKRYLAWVSPVPEWQEIEITSSISKQRDAKGRYSVQPDGRASHTTASVLDQNDGKALLSLTPHTGRTHQLRVHLQSLGCPILGDTRYGGLTYRRLMLHACDLTIRTPALPETMHWHVEPQQTPEGDWK